MKDFKLTNKERETVITFNADDKTANIYSTIPSWVNKIKKIDGWKEYGIGVEVDVPKSWVRLQRPNKLSPEAKAKLVARMKNNNPARKK